MSIIFGLSAVAIFASSGCVLQSPLSPESDSSAASFQRLRATLAQIGESVEPGSSVGIAVVDVETGEEAALNGSERLPLHSTFKTWLAVAVGEAIQRGALAWEERIFVSARELTYSYQPIAGEVSGEGREFSIEELLRWAVIHSDNPSTDILIQRLGGVEMVMGAIERCGVKNVVVDGDEKALDLVGKKIEQAAAGLPFNERAVFVRRNLREFPDQGTALGVAHGLAELVRGKLLNSDATARLLSIHSETVTGKARLKAGLTKGWTLGHKTGTGPVIAGVSTGINDIGFFTSPIGRKFAVAVLLSGSSEASDRQEAIISRVGNAITTLHSTPRLGVSIER